MSSNEQKIDTRSLNVQNLDIILIDGDSIAYMAAAAKTIEEAKSIVDDTMDRIKDQTWEGRYELFVETPKIPKINFRHHVAVTSPYKGNRKNVKKSPILNDVKQYMYDRYGAEFINIYESEDVIRFRAEELGENNFIIAAIDKDLDQIPGKRYDYRKGTRRIISSEQALLSFYTQILTGDSVDNIPGLPNVGPIKAKAMLEHVDSGNEMDLAEIVAIEYARRGQPYTYLVEQARLLYLLKSPQDVFIYPINEDEYRLMVEELYVKGG